MSEVAYPVASCALFVTFHFAAENSRKDSDGWIDGLPYFFIMLQHRLQFAKTQSVHDCSHVFVLPAYLFVQWCSNFSICVCAPICARKLAFCCVELLPTCPQLRELRFLF